MGTEASDLVAHPGALSSHQVVGFVLINVAIILVVARLCGIAARRLGQPAVVGEIVAGLLLGPTLLGPTLMGLDRPPDFLSCEAALAGSGLEPSVTTCLFPPQARVVLAALGQLALLLLMFLAGLEFDVSRLRGRGTAVTIVGVGAVAVPLGVAFLLQPLLFTDTFVGASEPSALSFNVFIGALISVTAFPVMVRILQEKGLATSQMGVIGVAAAAVVTVLMFVLVAVASAIAREASAAELGHELLSIALYLAAMIFVVPRLLVPLGRGYRTQARERGPIGDHGTGAELHESESPGVGRAFTPHLFAVIVVVVLVSGWIAHILGLSVIVGGFLAGMAMPARQGIMRDIAPRLFDVTAIVLLPIFLAFSGLNTDFTTLTVASLGALGVFIVASVVAKWPASAVLARTVGLRWAEANALGILLNCRGLLPLVVALIGIRLEVLSPVMQVGAVLMALVTTIMTGPLFDRFGDRRTSRTAGRHQGQAGDAREPGRPRNSEHADRGAR